MESSAILQVAKLRSTIVAELPEHAKDQIQHSQESFQEEAARLFAFNSDDALKNESPVEKLRPREKLLGQLPIKKKAKGSDILVNENNILKDGSAEKETIKVTSAGLTEGDKRKSKGGVAVNRGSVGLAQKVLENIQEPNIIKPADHEVALEEIGVKTRRIVSLFGKKPKEVEKKGVSKPSIRIEVIPKTQSRSKPPPTQPSSVAGLSLYSSLLS